MVAHTLTEARLASPNNQPFVEVEDGRALAEAIVDTPCLARKLRNADRVTTSSRQT